MKINQINQYTFAATSASLNLALLLKMKDPTPISLNSL